MGCIINLSEDSPLLTGLLVPIVLPQFTWLLYLCEDIALSYLEIKNYTDFSLYYILVWFSCDKPRFTLTIKRGWGRFCTDLDERIDLKDIRFKAVWN